MQHLNTYKHIHSIKQHSDKNKLSQRLISRSEPTTKNQHLILICVKHYCQLITH